MAPPLLPEYEPKDVDLLIERSNLDGLILAGVGYGILFTIFVQCVIVIRQAGTMSTKKQARWLLWYTGLMFVLATIGFAGNTKFIQMTYVDYRDFPGGPNAFTQVFYAHPVNMSSFVSYVLMSWLADGLVLYRFMLIYNFNIWFAILPCLVYMGVVAMSVALVVAIMSAEDTFWAARTITFGIAFWSLSIGLNIGLTLMIATRLFMMRNKIQAALGKQHSTPYISILSMLVESAALYSTWGMLFIILYARNSFLQNIFLPPLGQVQGIAPLLIIFRVGQGKAWSRDTVNATTRGSSLAIQSPMGSRGHNATNNSIPLSELATKVDIQVGKSTLVSQDNGSANWEGKNP